MAMHKLIFITIAALGVIPGVLLLIPALHRELDRPTTPRAADPTTSATLLYGYVIEIRIGGLRVPYHPRPWKTACLALGLTLHLVGLAAMFFGHSETIAVP
jgi:hypothetical protein